MECEHHYCKCRRADELARMADATGDGFLLAQSIAVHQTGVRVHCRRPEEAAQDVDAATGCADDQTFGGIDADALREAADKIL